MGDRFSVDDLRGYAHMTSALYVRVCSTVGTRPQHSKLWLIHILLLHESDNLMEVERSGSDKVLVDLVQNTADALIAEVDKIVMWVFNTHPEQLVIPVQKWFGPRPNKLPLGIYALGKERSMTRVINGLRRMEILDVDQLMQAPIDSLLRYRNVGDKMLAQLLSTLKQDGYLLPYEKEAWLGTFVSKNATRQKKED